MLCARQDTLPCVTMSVIKNETYKMTTREHHTKATGSAFDTTRLGKNGSLVRAGAHTMSSSPVAESAFGSSRQFRRGTAKRRTLTRSPW